MKLNTKSWHYKLWASTYDRGERPYSTDLCRYCHRIFWRLVLWAFMICALGACVFMLAYGVIYKGLICNTLPTLAVMGVLAAIVTVIVLYARWLNAKRSYSEPSTLVGKWARSAKQGVCPLVEFTDSEEE